jgi:hypothetical protein
MRGDTTPEWMNRPQDALDQYIHTYYEDIESIFRQKNFDLFDFAEPLRREEGTGPKRRFRSDM